MTLASNLVKRKKKFKFAKCDDKAVKMFDLSMQQRKKVKRIQKADEKHILFPQEKSLLKEGEETKPRTENKQTKHTNSNLSP